METVTVKTTLIVDENGVLGTTESYDLDQAGQIAIDVELVIPKALFEPLKVKVEIPEDFTYKQPVIGSTKAIEIPVTIADKKGHIQIVEEVRSPGWGNNVLALLRKSIFGS